MDVCTLRKISKNQGGNVIRKRTDKIIYKAWNLPLSLEQQSNLRKYNDAEMATRLRKSTNVLSSCRSGRQPSRSKSGRRLVPFSGQLNPALKMSPKIYSTVNAVGKANTDVVRIGRMRPTKTNNSIESRSPTHGLLQEQNAPILLLK